MKQITSFFLLLSIVVLSVGTTSCKSKKVAMDAKDADLDDRLAAVIDSSNHYSVTPQNITFKANAKVESDDRTNRMTLYIRIEHDSAVWVSARSMGMEVSRFMALKDSVFFVNKIEKTYYRGDFKGLNDKFGLSLSFYELQSMLLANPHWPENKKGLELVSEDDNYTVVNTNPEPLIKQNKPIVNAMINPKNYRVTKLMISDPPKNRGATVEYSDFELHDEQYIIPTEINIFVRSAKPATLEMSYSKIKINEDGLIFPFKFYDAYDPIP